MTRLKNFLLAVAIFFSQQVSGQYILNGSAKQDNCNCYTLTPEQNGVSGSVWNSNKISLKAPFDFWFNVYLGCKDATGADGVVFMLQPLSTSVGASGGGMGFSGVQPSIGIPIDTYRNVNDNDPTEDHISIQANGNLNHNSDLAGPVPASATGANVEDCQWHKLRISWDPVTQWLRAYFDDVLRVEKQMDLVGSIFNGDPLVYWGFSAATGGLNNFQKFCTALNPRFSTDSPRDTVCLGTPVHFSDRSESFAPITKYFWDFGDGTTAAVKDPGDHLYSQPGIYSVRLAITGQDGCSSDTLVRKITVGAFPDAAFTVGDACYKKSPPLTPPREGVGIAYEWRLNGSVLSPDRVPDLRNLSAGAYTLQARAYSLFGCGAERLETKEFVIQPAPLFSMQIGDGCVGAAIPYEALLAPNSVAARDWQWTFGDGTGSGAPSGSHRFARKNRYDVQVWATAPNGCTSDTAKKAVSINKAYVIAGTDTMILKNDPTPFTVLGEGAFRWTPSAGLNNDRIPNPVITLTNDQTYRIEVVTPEGCTATDDLSIRVFSGAKLYIPDAFTPNGDGKNDLFRPLLDGVRQLHYFSIYNRWGERVFHTTNKRSAWNGTWKDQPLSTGTFVWILNATDLEGKAFQLKGTLTLIR